MSIRSDKYIELKPAHLSHLKERIELKGKYYIEKPALIPLVEILRLLEKAVSIVENTEEYTEYLIFDTFGDKKSYNKVPPGTIRIYSKTLFCFFNGRCWRKLK